ncbi:MAG TPA: aminotransferase class V-fold PLP-dependent enzyme [Bacteroidota bacterium]
MASVDVTGLFPSSKLQEIRALFPHLKSGQIYLNHASISPLSLRVVDAMTNYLHTHADGTLVSYEDELKIESDCRIAVQQMINAESKDRIALVGNTSDAINIVASGLPWQRGDRIILNDMEFPANVYPYFHLQEQGIIVDIIQCRDGRITVEMIERTITPRTRVVALSAVQFLSGFRADLSSIGQLCRDRGIWFIVDGIQAVGATQIDVRAMQIDGLAAGAQKWQMSVQGTGFLYVNEALQSAIQPKYVGWLAVQDAWNFYNYGQPLAATAKRYEGGTVNHLGFSGMAASLTLLLQQGMQKIEAHILALTRILNDGFQALERVKLLSPVIDNERAGIVTIELPGNVDTKTVFKRLLDTNIVISLREGKLRYSPHFYNSPEEMRTAIETTRDLVLQQ